MSTAVERYLREVGSRLPGSRRVRADHLDELRDGLLTAVEQRPDGETGYAEVVADFGDPAVIAAALGREIHLREARRSALRLLGVLVVMAVLWHAYRDAYGTPSALIPDGWSRPVFLAGTDIIRIAPAVAMASAVLLAATASLRSAHTWVRFVHRASGVGALFATTLFCLSAAAIAATANAAHRLEVLALALPVALLTAFLLWSAARAAGHGRRAFQEVETASRLP
ncbi:hypothetical protein LO763_27920 [Glycomyces sp. A-F 0318]|uniref:HAAS signaling domain-containing protein n=1 Tax=Glycomyces amatae TaxID=2881355 RepID=UPI001E4FCC27|nr:hypothetical protein [Glycomyces amatae]MCD0447448.1 hypothetical protein [Glycomyces amatae]